MILALNASVNLYMFEGGTNFGFMNGEWLSFPAKHPVNVVIVDGAHFIVASHTKLTRPLHDKYVVHAAIYVAMMMQNIPFFSLWRNQTYL